ncbi:MAG: ABC transporter permease [Bacteroidetes bacterium]|nr:ABC transporter permease [Bacteroidota bacterium]
MSFEFFISRRLAERKTQGKKVSRPIVRISIISIALTIVVNLISLAIVTGFQHEVRQKAMGFTSPLFVSKINPDESGQRIRLFESEPIKYSNLLHETLQREDGVSKVSPILYRPTILQSKKFSDNITLASGKDTSVTRQEIAGIMMKGVDEAYDWSFIQQHLVYGKIPTTSQKNALVLSQHIANNLNYTLGDTVLASFFTTNRALKRDFVVTAIYNSGFSDYDQQLAFTPLAYLQEVSGLDFRVRLEIKPTLTPNGFLEIEALTNRGKNGVEFSWNGNLGSSKINWEIGGPENIELIAFTQNAESKLESDTMLISFNWKSVSRVADLENNEELNIEYDQGTFQIGDTAKSCLLVHVQNPVYKEGAFISGYEIGLEDVARMDEQVETLREHLQLKPDKYGNIVQVTTVKEAQSDLFAWLDFLDINVYIIITLMLLIGVINVGSTILVIIVVRTNFVGIMKAIGASNWSIRKVFIFEVGYLILKGLILGNIIGCGLCFLQLKWKVFSLDSSIYYLDSIPVHFSWLNFILINLLTFFVCLLALVIPSFLVLRINPIKSIRFN